jgi:hypothetical protein
MSDAAPDPEPKPQPKFSGGPPRPPKITARGIEDGSPKDPDPLVNLLTATRQAGRLTELLESIRGSRLHALNMLEAELDECIVRLSKLIEQLGGEHQKLASWHLQTIRDYRRKNPRLETGDREIREQAKKILDEV